MQARRAVLLHHEATLLAFLDLGRRLGSLPKIALPLVLLKSHRTLDEHRTTPCCKRQRRSACQGEWLLLSDQRENAISLHLRDGSLIKRTHAALRSSGFCLGD